VYKDEKRRGNWQRKKKRDQRSIVPGILRELTADFGWDLLNLARTITRYEKAEEGSATRQRGG